MKAAFVLAVLVIIAVSILVGGWALMMALSILGVSVSYGQALVVFLLFRLFILPPTSTNSLKERS